MPQIKGIHFTEKSRKEDFRNTEKILRFFFRQ